MRYLILSVGILLSSCSSCPYELKENIVEVIGKECMQQFELQCHQNLRHGADEVSLDLCERDAFMHCRAYVITHLRVMSELQNRECR